MSINKFANIAKTMAPGTFAILDYPGDGSGYSATFTETSPNHYTFNSFASKHVYDPLWRRVLILGDGSHWEIGGVLQDTSKFACYELDYDRWTLLPYTPWTMFGNLHVYRLAAHVSKPGTNWFFRMGGNNLVVHRWNTDFANPQNIAYLGSSYPTVGDPATSPVARGNLEYFPERDEMLYQLQSSGQLFTKPLASGSWTLKTTDVAMTHEGFGMLYNPVSKCIVWGGGSDDATSATTNKKWWRYDVSGTITPLDDFSSPALDGFLQFAGKSLIAADPGSGKFILIRADWVDISKVGMWELNPLAASGSQWTRLSPAIEALWPADLYTTSTDDITCCTIPEYNVIHFAAFNKTWLYKHGPGLSFTQKASVKGVLSSHPFSSQSEMKYTWPNAGSPGAAPIEAYMRSIGSGAGYDYPWPYSGNRVPGEGNSQVFTHPVSNYPAVPQIDGANGLRFQIPTRSWESVGDYNANFDDILYADPNAAVAINPTSPYGRVFYVQAKIKADANFWSTMYRQCDPFDIDTNSQAYTGLSGASCLAGSNILAVPPTAGYGVFSALYVGKEMLILPGSGGWVTGYYFITQFIDAQHVRLDRSPCPSAAGQLADVRIEGTVDHGFGVPQPVPGGVKLFLLAGNPPNYDTPFLISTLKQNRSGVYHNGPHFVQGRTGIGPIDANFNDELYWDQANYNEFTFRIEVGTVPASGTSSAGWRCTWWLNGIKYDPETDWYDGPTWGGPVGYWSTSPSVGFGWFQISIQTTHKDPTQTLPLANIWVKDVIISTQPIQMTAVTSAADIPAAPCLPWFLRG